jgi:hypothetical protein
LKEMGKDFIKFMVLVVIVYCGFLTTFSLVGREKFSFQHMTMILTKIFFGSSYVGFDIMDEIDPIFGPPLMIIFVTLSSILLMGSLTGMLSNSFSRVITHAREEYLYIYSVYVLEASTSNRLTHFYPPFNLLALIIFRPLRLFLPSNQTFRGARILLLKVTHLPIVGVIQLYEFISNKLYPRDEREGSFKGPRNSTIRPSSSGTPKKRSSRPPMHEPTTSYQSGMSPRPQSSSEVPLLGPPPSRRRTDNSSKAVEAAEADDIEASSVELRLSDLSAKIDKLTELVVQLQSQGPQSLAEVALS